MRRSFDLMQSPWPVAAGGFDLVGAASVINYGPNAERFIANMAAAVKPGGHIILSYLAGQDNAEAVMDDGGMSYLWSGAEIKNRFVENEIEHILSRDVQTYSGRGLQRIDTVAIGVKGYKPT